jgi:hypothetical protein
MQSIIPERPRGTLPLPPADPEKPRLRSRGRLTRLAALSPGQRRLALAFLAGYRPSVFDAVLSAIEHCADEQRLGEFRAARDSCGPEPYCVRCGDPVGIFLAHGKEYRHYRGVVTVTSKPRPYRADHAPVIGWRAASDLPATVAG